MDIGEYKKQRNKKYILSGAELEHFLFEYLKKFNSGGKAYIWGTVRDFLKDKDYYKVGKGKG